MSNNNNISSNNDILTQINNVKKEIEFENEQHKKNIEFYTDIINKKQSEKERKNNDESTFLSKESALKSEISRLKQEIADKISSEKEKLLVNHEKILAEKEQKQQKIIENLRQKYESDIGLLRKQLEQQIEYNKITADFENKSGLISEILRKINSQSLDKAQNQEETKFNLQKLEQKLKKMEDEITKDKERLFKEKESYEREQAIIRKLNSEEITRLKLEREKVLENERKLKEASLEEKVRIEKENAERKHELLTLKNEAERAKKEYGELCLRVESERRAFKELKESAERHKNSVENDLDLKVSEMEKRRVGLMKTEKEIRDRIRILSEKDSYVSEKMEEILRIKEELEGEERRLMNHRNDLLLSAKRLESSTQEVNEKINRLERQKEELLRQFNEVENERILINNLRLKNDEMRTEYRIKLKNYEMGKTMENYGAGLNEKMTEILRGEEI